jgi:predicted DNA-binding transcriptional regulator AlpA
MVPTLKRPKVRRVTVTRPYIIRNDPNQQKLYVTRHEVANMLGVQISTIARLMRNKDINVPRPMKLGNKIMHWMRLEIVEFMERDELRGIGVRSAHKMPWIGGTKDMPAYPWVLTIQPKEPADERDQQDHGGGGEVASP